MKAPASLCGRGPRTSFARLALCALGCSLLVPVACGDDSGDDTPAPTRDQGGEAGQSDASGGTTAGKPSAGASNGGASNGGSNNGGASNGGSNNGNASNGGSSNGGASEAGMPGMGGEGHFGGAAGGGSPAQGGAAGASASGTAGEGGNGGEAPVCDDVLPDAGCADADPNTVDGQSKVFGGCVHVNQVSPGHGWIAYQSFGVDIASGLAFVQTAQIKNHDEIAAACEAMTVQGVSGWRLPTIDEARLLAGGCTPTASGGSCPISDPSCLNSSCGFASPQCESCLGSQGPHKSKGYCRPEVPFCLNAATSSACQDCSTVGFWTYGIINGNFYSAKATDQMFLICVKADVPGALPCSL